MLDGLTRRNMVKLLAFGVPGAMEAVASAQQSVKRLGSSEDAILLNQHPRLFYDSKTIAHLRAAKGAATDWLASLTNQGETLLRAQFIPESEAMQGEGQHASYFLPGRQMMEMGLSLGLLYQITREERYAKKLKDALFYYIRYVRWEGQQFETRTPSWHSELSTTKFCFGFATAYDALHSFLTPKERHEIADALIRLGIQPLLDDWLRPGTRIHSFDSMGHNWWGVCVSAAGVAALALLGDEPRAGEWIDTIDAGIQQWFDYPGNILQNRMPTFERSGPSYEGVHYTYYALTEYLRYRLAWQNTFPARKPHPIPCLKGVATFFLQTMYPTAQGQFHVNFEDASLAEDATQAILLLLACGIQTPDALRYLQRVKSTDKSILTSLLERPRAKEAISDASTSALYSHMGWAMLRDCWKNDATLLAVKSGYTWNHAHADAGTYILFKDGMPLIIDSGTSAYGRPEYSSYYRQSVAHNVILANGDGQPVADVDYGCKFPGSVHCLIDGLGLKYVYADSTGPMARHFSRSYRHWLWSGNVILIIDDVRAHSKTAIDWLLHYQGNAAPTRDGGVILTNGRAKASVRMLFPANQKQERHGLSENNPDLQTTFLSFSPTQEQASYYLITAICLTPEAAPEFRVTEQPDVIKVHATAGTWVEDTYLNLRAINGSIHGSSAISVDGWSTDAYLLQVRSKAGEAERFFVSDGSYLRRSDVTLAESLTKFTGCWKRADRLEVILDPTGSPVDIAVGVRPGAVFVNGEVGSAIYHPELRMVRVRLPR